MKKVIFLILLLLCFSVYAQERLNFSVIEEDVSFGLFSNELGAAVDPNLLRTRPAFSSLDKNYILFGLSGRHDNYDSNYVYNSFSSPFPVFYLGGYSKDLKATGLLSYSAESVASTYDNGYSTSFTTNKAVGSTTYTYIYDVIEYTYSALSIDEYAFDAGAIKMFGDIVMGLALSFDLSKGRSYGTSTAAADSYAAANYVYTRTIYYDAAGASSAPDPQVDYTYTWTESSPDTDMTLSVMFPLFIPMDGGIKGLGLSGRLTWNNVNNSSSGKAEYSKSKSTSPTFLGVTDREIVDYYNTFTLRSDATVSFAPVFKGDDRNLLNLIVSGSFGMIIPSTYTSTTTDRDITVSPASVSELLNSTTEITTERGIGLTYSMSAEVEHPVYFVFGNWAEFAMSPSAGLAVSYTGSSYNKSQTQVTKTDGTGDGDFNDAGDTVTTTTTTYYNYNDNDPIYIRVPVDIATSFKWKSPDWIFGLTVGAMGGFSPEISLLYDKVDTTEQKVETKDGTGAVTGVTDTQRVTGDHAGLTTKLGWSFYNYSRLALNFYLPNDIKFDVLLNGANLLNFDSLNMQLIIPLP